MAPNFVQRVGLARAGGKQAILKCADHRFIERSEFVSHNGSTSFPWARLRALREYHAGAERCKSFSGSCQETCRINMQKRYWKRGPLWYNPGQPEGAMTT